MLFKEHQFSTVYFVSLYLSQLKLGPFFLLRITYFSGYRPTADFCLLFEMAKMTNETQIKSKMKIISTKTINCQGVP